MANIARHRVSANSNTSAIPEGYHIFILDVPSRKSPQETPHVMHSMIFVLF